MCLLFRFFLARQTTFYEICVKHVRLLARLNSTNGFLSGVHG